MSTRPKTGLLLFFSGGAAPVYTISGTVLDGASPVEGATVAIGAYSAVTAADGTYAISGIPPGTTGSLTASKSLYMVLPTISVSAMSGNLSNQDFSAFSLIGVLRSDAGLYQDAAGTTPAVANNDPVGLWQDQSGNARHVSQSTDGLRAKITTNQFNGKPAVTGFPAAGYLQSAVFGAPIAQPITVYLVCKFPAVSNYYGILDGISSNHQFAGSRFVPDEYVMVAGATFGRGTQDGNKHVLTALYNGASSLLRVDGVQQGLAGNAGTNALDGLTVGNVRAFNGTAGTSLLASIVLVNGIDTAAEMALMEAYLTAEFGPF
jgi:hypothetical protein